MINTSSLDLNFMDPVVQDFFHPCIFEAAEVVRAFAREFDSDQMIDGDGYVEVARMLRRSYGFTSEERADLLEKYDKFLAMTPGAHGINLPTFRRFLLYLGYNVGDDDFARLVKSRRAAGRQSGAAS